MNTIVVNSNRPEYFEMDPGDTINLVDPNGRHRRLELIDLLEPQDRRVLMQLDNQTIYLPFGRAADPRAMQPANSPSTTIEVDGLQLGGEVANKFFRKNTRYEHSFCNLSKSLRAWVHPAQINFSETRHTFPVPGYTWNFGDNWLQPTPYGLHLGIDLYAESGNPIISPTNGYVLARRELDDDDPEDLWGNLLAVAGDDGFVYLMAHCRFNEQFYPGQRVVQGATLGWLSNSGFTFTPILPHLHFGMLYLNKPGEFTFEFEPFPTIQFLHHDLRLPVLPARCQGYAINPYPFLLEWY